MEAAGSDSESWAPVAFAAKAAATGLVAELSQSAAELAAEVWALAPEAQAKAAATGLVAELAAELAAEVWAKAAAAVFAAEVRVGSAAISDNAFVAALLEASKWPPISSTMEKKSDEAAAARAAASIAMVPDAVLAEAGQQQHDALG